MATAMSVAIAGLGLGASMFTHGSSAGAQESVPGSTMVPKFSVDPLWPKPLPNHWLMGNVIGVSVDKNDNVWAIHRPGTLEAKESYLTRKESDCCVAAPDVIEWDPAGNVINSWGRDPGKVDKGGHDWPSSNHGITVAPDGTIWLGANGAGQPGLPPGSAEFYAAQTAAAARRAAPRAAPAAGAGGQGEGGGEVGRYHDSFMLHFTTDGKWLGEIGSANGSKGSLDTNNVRGVAQIRFLPDGTLVAADGYGNHRVSEWDPKTGKNVRIWGAYGKPPSDAPIPHYNVNSPQFGNPVHCAQPSNDGILYVCDRTNNRIQTFKFDGTYLNQYILEPNTKGDGAPWEIAFSRDPAQKYMYVSDGSNEKIHVYDRAAMKELYSFGGGGRTPGMWYAVHSIVTDSKGNILTTETYRGQRVQKFMYQGIVPLSSLIAAKVVGGSIINP
jgi:WD40 repeat protein